MSDESDEECFRSLADSVALIELENRQTKRLLQQAEEGLKNAYEALAKARGQNDADERYYEEFSRGYSVRLIRKDGFERAFTEPPQDPMPRFYRMPLPPTPELISDVCSAKMMGTVDFLFDRVMKRHRDDRPCAIYREI